MNYSDRIVTRFAQFAAMKAELAYGETGDVALLGFERLEDVDHFITVNWAVNATTKRGLPAQPYEVGIATVVSDAEDGGFARAVGPFQLNAATGHRWDADALFVTNRDRPWGVLCLCLIARAGQGGAEIYCSSFDGREIYGSRVTVDGQDRKCAFFGPNIFEIRATADVTITNIAVFTIKADRLKETTFKSIAAVGPAFEPTVEPKAWPYENQSYLHKHNLTPADALALRQLADGIARGNTNPPALPRLIREVHQQIPSSIAKAIGNIKEIQMLADNIDAYLLDPAASFETETDPTHPSGGDAFSLSFAQFVQLLARQGPVEALTLGNAVTIPLAKDDRFIGQIRTMEAAFDEMEGGKMPYPLIRVWGRFYDAELKTYAEEFGFAGLDLLIDGQLRPRSEPAGYFEPEMLDEPGTIAVRTRLHKNASSLISYVSKEDTAGDQQVIDEKGRPRSYFPDSTDPDERNATGAPELWIGLVDMPLAAETDERIWIHPRDMFGRWPKCEAAPCHLLPRPVGAPDLLSSSIIRSSDETLSVELVFEWDRSVRRLQSVSLGLAFTNAPSDTGPVQIKPADGLSCPALPPRTALILDFDLDGTPKNSIPLPAGVRIVNIALPPQLPDIMPGKPADNRMRYALTIALGSVRDIMQLRKDSTCPLLIYLVGDACEYVSGTRRTMPPLPQLASELHDPRSAVLDIQPWAITWTGLPNNETNEARASLALPRVTGDVPAETFSIWRAQETAVLAFALQRRFSDPNDVDAYLAAVRRELRPALRLALIQPLVQPLLKDPAFMKALSTLFKADSTRTIARLATSIEITLPAQQTGFEFVLFTATTLDGQQSSKAANPCMRVVAIPRPTTTSAPGLHVITWDDAGHFELAGLCLAIVSYPEPFEGGHARFFWDRGSAITDASELRFNLQAVTELDLAEAGNYISKIQELIESSVPFENTRCFILTPPITQDVHHFAVELQDTPGGSNPAAQIPTLRSQVTSVFMR